VERFSKRPWFRYLVVSVASAAVGAAAVLVALRSAPATAPSPTERPAEEADPHAGMPGMEAPVGGDHPAAASGGAVYISPTRQQLIGVRTAAIGHRELSTTIRTVGTLAYDETRVARIHTKVSGWVEEVFVDYVGRQVQRGESLLTVYSPELVSTQNEYLLALRNRAELQASQVAVTRDAAEALVSAARDRLGLWDIPEEHIRELEESGTVRKTLMLHSPFDGVVLERSAFPGQYVTPEMALFEIADLSTVWALGAVFEYELPLIRLGQAVEIEFAYGRADRRLAGRITFISPEIDPHTRRVRIRAEFPNPGLELKPESFVTMVIRTGADDHHLAIPKEAVIDTGTRRYALLAHPDGYFEPREIEVGAPSDDHYPLLGGLDEGDRIVVSAQFLVDSETNLQAAMESMIGMHGADMPADGGAMEEPSPEPPPAAPQTPPGGDQQGTRQH
jgi:multidrug efflux pump subunit AcrA (membrane-fusion protein)